MGFCEFQAVKFSQSWEIQRIYITNAWTSAEERVYKLRNYVIGHFLRSIVSWSMAHSNDST